MNEIATPATAKDLVLVVDDDDVFRKYITDLIEALGISCLSAGTVEQAVTILEQKKISVLLLDWCLDRIATEVVRAAQRVSSRMPIIIMSGQPYAVQLDALCLETDEFLEKSLGGNIIANRVKRWTTRFNSPSANLLPTRPEDILTLDDLKRLYTRHVVELVGNNVSLAAEKLGVHRQTVAAALA